MFPKLRVICMQMMSFVYHVTITTWVEWGLSDKPGTHECYEAPYQAFAASTDADFLSSWGKFTPMSPLIDQARPCNHLLFPVDRTKLCTGYPICIVKTLPLHYFSRLKFHLICLYNCISTQIYILLIRI